MVISGMILKEVNYECDYSSYLGPGYKKKFNNPVSTIIGNHITAFDSMIILQFFSPFGLITAAENLKSPYLAPMVKVLNCLFVERAATKEIKD